MQEVMRPSLVQAPDRIPIPSASLSPEVSGQVWSPEMQTVFDSPPSLFTYSQETISPPDFSGIQQKVKKI